MNQHYDTYTFITALKPHKKKTQYIQSQLVTSHTSFNYVSTKQVTNNHLSMAVKTINLTTIKTHTSSYIYTIHVVFIIIHVRQNIVTSIMFFRDKLFIT